MLEANAHHVAQVIMPLIMAQREIPNNDWNTRLVGRTSEEKEEEEDEENDEEEKEEDSDTCEEASYGGHRNMEGCEWKGIPAERELRLLGVSRGRTPPTAFLRAQWRESCASDGDCLLRPSHDKMR